MSYKYNHEYNEEQKAIYLEGVEDYADVILAKINTINTLVEKKVISADTDRMKLLKDFIERDKKTHLSFDLEAQEFMDEMNREDDYDD